MEVLIFLALIPFALTGLFLVGYIIFYGIYYGSKVGLVIVPLIIYRMKRFTIFGWALTGLLAFYVIAIIADAF